MPRIPLRSLAALCVLAVATRASAQITITNPRSPQIVPELTPDKPKVPPADTSKSGVVRIGGATHTARLLVNKKAWGPLPTVKSVHVPVGRVELTIASRGCPRSRSTLARFASAPTESGRWQRASR